MSINQIQEKFSESKVFKDVSGSSANYSSNKKANKAVVWSSIALLLLILGFFVKEVSIIVIFATASIGAFYARSAKKEDGENISKKVKTALLITKIISITIVIVFFVNIFALTLK